jgi:hypothetical protein
VVVYCLVPVSSHHYYCCKVVIDSIVLDDNPSTSIKRANSSEIIFSKLLNLRNITVACSNGLSLEKLSTSIEFQDFNGNSSNPFKRLVVNPCNFQLKVSGAISYDKNESTFVYRDFSIAVFIDSLQFNVDSKLIHLLSSTLQYYKREIQKSDISEIRRYLFHEPSHSQSIDHESHRLSSTITPLVNSSSTRSAAVPPSSSFPLPTTGFNPHLHWKFVIASVLYQVKGDSILQKLRWKRRHSPCRKQYSDCYLSKMLYILQEEYFLSVEIPNFSINIQNCDEYRSVSNQIMQFNYILPSSEIISIRTKVHLILLNYGLSLDMLKCLICLEETLVFPRSFIRKVSSYVASFGRKSHDNRHLIRSFSKGKDESHRLSFLSIHISFRLENIHIDFIEESVVPSHPSSRLGGAATNNRFFLSLNDFFLQLAGSSEEYCSAEGHLTGISLLANKNLLLSMPCLKRAENKSDVHAAGGVERAISCTFQHFSVSKLVSSSEKIIRNSSSNSYQNLRSFLSTNLRKERILAFYEPYLYHNTLELKLGKLHIVWVPQALNPLLHTISSFVPLASAGCDNGRSEKTRLSTLSVNRNQILFTQPAKLSLDLLLDSVSVSFPTVGEESIIFCVDTVRVLAGDYLSPYLQEIQCSSLPKDIFPVNCSPDLFAQMVKRLKPFLHPLMVPFLLVSHAVSVDCVGNISSIPVLFPVSLYCFYGMSSVVSNPDFCESFLSLFSSTVEIEVNLKVLPCCVPSPFFHFIL